MGWPCAAIVLNLGDAPGFAAGCHFGAGSSRINPARPERAVHGVRQNIACGLRRRPGLGATRHRRSAPLDDGGRVQRNLCAVPFSAGSERRQPVGGVRIALPGIPGSVAAFAGLLGPPVVIMTALAALYARYGEIDALRRILAGVSCAAVGLLLSAVFRMTMPLVKRRDLVGLVLLAAVFVAIGLLRLPLPAVLLVAIPLSIALSFAMRRRVPA